MLFQVLINLWIYGKEGCHLFTMQFFHSFPHDGSFLNMERHPIAGHSEDTLTAPPD